MMSLSPLEFTPRIVINVLARGSMLFLRLGLCLKGKCTPSGFGVRGFCTSIPSGDRNQTIVVLFLIFDILYPQKRRTKDHREYDQYDLHVAVVSLRKVNGQSHRQRADDQDQRICKAHYHVQMV